jgi:nicotinate-nucleotide--dimethylbenzimidazole phosphoribosyltransferase
MRLGEGTGATLAMGVMEGAVRMFKEVLTFEEAGVANK